jgi:hypothetical protein
MIEMRGADAYFLREESNGRHMHTLKIAVVDPTTSHQPLSFERVRAGASLAMPMQLPFRVRPVPMPGGARSSRLDRGARRRPRLPRPTRHAPGGLG